MAKVTYRLGGGLNLKPGTDQIGDDELLQATGVRFDEFGVITSEPGRTLKATLAQSGSAATNDGDTIYGMFDFELDSIHYVAIEDSHAWLTILYESPFTEVSLLNPALAFHPLSGIMYNGVTYLANGLVNRRLIKTATSAAVTAGGTGYVVGEVLTLTGGTFGYNTSDAVTSSTWTVATVSATAVTSVTLLAAGKYGTTPTAPAETTSNLSGTGCTLTVTFGTTLERVGLDAPAAAPAFGSETGSGGSVSGATYKWVYTFFNGVAESNFSPSLSHTFAAGAKQAALTTIAVGASLDAATISRRVYRTDQAGESFFFVTEIANNTGTTFTDPMGLPPSADSEAVTGDEITDEQRKGDKKRFHAALRTANREAHRAHVPFRRSEFRADYYADERISKGEIIQTNLGILAEWNDHYRPQSGASGGLRNIRHLGDNVYGIMFNNSLVFSNLFNPEQFDRDFDRVRIGRDTGDELLDIQPLDADMICLTRLGVWKFRRLGTDATNSTLEQVTNITGTAGPASACITDKYGIIFLGFDGVYRYDGRRLEKISTAIDDIFNDSSNSDYATLAARKNCVMVSKDNKVWISYTTGSYTAGTNFNNRTLMLDYQEGKPKWSLSAFGYTSFLVGYDGRVWGGDNDDKVYWVDVDDASTSKTMTIQTKYFPIVNEFQGTQPDTLMIDMDCNNITTTVTLLGDEATTVMTWTITGSTGRVKHRKLVPMGKIYDRYSVQITSSGSAVRKVWGISFLADDARLE